VISRSIVVFTFGACRLCAQSPLSLADAISTALRSRAVLQASAEQVAVADGLKRQAGLFPNPEFQFQNENLRPGQTYTRDVDTLALINQPLDILGKRRERVAAAEETRGRAQADHQLARWQLAQRVKLAYWTARGAQEVRNVWNTTQENFQKIVDFHAARLSTGAIAEQDFLRVRLEGERLKISYDLSALDADKARLELYREMGRTDFADAVLTESLESSAEVTPVGVEQVLARRADIQAARAALRQAEANVRLQEVNARPDLNATAGYKRTQLPDALTGVNTILASIRITLPFIDKNQGNRAAAEAEVRRQRNLLSEAEATVRADYAAALQEYEFRRQEYRTRLQPLREHAEEITRIAAAAYNEGGTDLLRLLDAQRAGVEAELVRTEGLVAFRQSIARLESAEGIE